MNRGKSIVRDWTDVDHLAALEERLHGVTLEHDDALKVIERYDTPRTLHYVDPPYPAETRNPRWAKKGYTHEFSDPEQHRRLAEVLDAAQGMVALSGRPCALYAELFENRGWSYRETTLQQESGGPQVERLWLNPQLQAALAAEDEQMVLPGVACA